MTLLLARRHRSLLAVWAMLLFGLPAATAWAYQATYDTEARRIEAVELARVNPAMQLLYGRLEPGATPGAMFVWEMGAFVTILAGVAGVLVAVAVSRSPEDDGTLELVRATGVAPTAPLAAAGVVLVGEAVGLAAGSGAAIGVWAGHVDGVTGQGAAAFGAVVGLAFLLMAALTVLLAQVVPSSAAAYGAGFGALAVAVAARAEGDIAGPGWLNAMSPLALRWAVRPMASAGGADVGERWWAALAWALVLVPLAVLTVAAQRRREYGAGLIARRDRWDRRLAIRGTTGLSARLGRRSMVAWTAGVAAIGAALSAMGSGVVAQSRDGELGGFLGAQIGDTDPAAGYLGYVGTVVGLLASAFAVSSVLRARREEEAGLTQLVLAVGVRRWGPLAGQVAASAAGLAVVLVATGALSAAVAPAVIDGPGTGRRAFAFMVGQWPGAAVLGAVAALLVGLAPTRTWLAWIPLGASAVLALLGDLLGLPAGLVQLGAYGHVPDAAGPDPAVGPLAVLVVVAMAASAGGLVAVARRDSTVTR